MKRWEKILWVWFMIVILAIAWASIRAGKMRIEKRFSPDPLVTQSIDSGGRVSMED